MAGVVIKMDPKAWHRWLSGLGERYIEAGLRGIRSGAKRCIPILHAATDIAPPASPKGSRGAFSSGAYKRAWKSQPLDNGAVVFNDVPYAGVIEKGRRPGKRQPPTKPIEKWLLRRAGFSAEEAKAAAFPIARAIGKRGLKAREIMKSSMDKMINAVMEEIKHELDVEAKKR